MLLEALWRAITALCKKRKGNNKFRLKLQHVVSFLVSLCPKLMTVKLLCFF